MITRLIWTIWTPMSSVPKKADKLNLSLLSVTCAVLVQYLSCHCTFCTVLPVVVCNTLHSSCGTLTICVLDVGFIHCFVPYMSVSFPLSWYTNSQLLDMNEYELYEYQTGNGQVPFWMRNGQADNWFHWRVICWLSVCNFEHAQNSRLLISSFHPLLLNITISKRGPRATFNSHSMNDKTISMAAFLFLCKLILWWLDW